MAHKLRRRNSRHVYLTCAAILGTHCLLYWVLTSKRLARDDRGPDLAAVANPGGSGAVRPAAIRTWVRAIYPYSVIRGGAYSIAELDAAMRADPVVATHYAPFDRTRVRMTRAPVSAAVHVSYRQGNRIYWTRRKVQLAAGEPLLTDGVHAARARCGNRISLTAPEPGEAGEPDIDLDLPEPPPTADAVPSDVFSLPMMAHEIFPALLGNGLPPGGPGSSVGPPLDGAGAPGGMGFPISQGGSPPPGFWFPPLPEFTLPPPIPSVWPIDFTAMPAPPVGSGFVWIPPLPLPGGFVVGSITGSPPWGPPAPPSPWGPPPIPGAVPIPGATPGSTFVPGITPFPTESGRTPPSSTGTIPPSQPLFPKDGPLPFDAGIPEPATGALLLCGAAILACRRFTRRIH